jgi:hypothetical protein
VSEGRETVGSGVLARVVRSSALPPDRSRRSLRAWILAIDPTETSFARRGFASCRPAVRATLEEHGQAFVWGFNAALDLRELSEFHELAREADEAERGFAYEGAAMAAALLDLMPLGRPRRLAALLADAGSAHVYMIHVGAGWALARMRRRPWGRLPVDPLLRWLAVDGYGFHEGFFRPARTIRRQLRPRAIRGYAVRAFDQGLGRSLWFVDGASSARIAATVERFSPDRRADVWSGVALAAAYAGGVGLDEYERLRDGGSGYVGELAQGAAFAAAARLRAGNLGEHTETACWLLCGCGPGDATRVVESALEGLPDDGAGDTYELWRARIRKALLGVPGAEAANVADGGASSARP